MNLHIFQNQQELNEAGAGIITSLVQMQPKAVLGLATGGTPVGIYEELVKAYDKGRVSFKSVTTFNLDEYVGLPIDHPESYHAYMQQHLFAHIDLPAARGPYPKRKCSGSRSGMRALQSTFGRSETDRFANSRPRP